MERPKHVPAFAVLKDQSRISMAWWWPQLRNGQALMCFSICQAEKPRVCELSIVGLNADPTKLQTSIDNRTVAQFMAHHDTPQAWKDEVMNCLAANQSIDAMTKLRLAARWEEGDVTDGG